MAKGSREAFRASTIRPALPRRVPTGRFPLSELDERRIGDWIVRIDRLICVGFGDCIDEAPGTFLLDEEGIAVFRDGQSDPPERLLEACRSCPVDALTVVDPEGRTLAP